MSETNGDSIEIGSTDAEAEPKTAMENGGEKKENDLKVAWEMRELELLNKISKYELQNIQDQEKISQLESQMKLKNEEQQNNKNKIEKLEGELIEALKNQTDSQEVHNLKIQSEELLSKAKGIIFEKTKLCKNQELQIEALSQQVQSLKEVVGITKDLLDIRNMEVKHLHEKLTTMEERINGEKDRHQLMHSKLEKMIQMNAELKREYETQLCLFNALRERYSERELARGVLNQLNINGEASADESASSAANASTSSQSVPDNSNKLD